MYRILIIAVPLSLGKQRIFYTPLKTVADVYLAIAVSSGSSKVQGSWQSKVLVGGYAPKTVGSMLAGKKWRNEHPMNYFSGCQSNHHRKSLCFVRLPNTHSKI